MQGRHDAADPLSSEHSLHQQQNKLKDVLAKFTAHPIFQSEPPVRVAYCDRTIQFEKLMDVAVPPFLAKFPTVFGAWDKELTQFSESLLDLFGRGATRLDGLFVGDVQRERSWVVQLIAFVRHMNVWDRRVLEIEAGAPTPSQLGDRAITVAAELLVCLGVETLEGQRGPEPWKRFKDVIERLLRCSKGWISSSPPIICFNLTLFQRAVHNLFPKLPLRSRPSELDQFVQRT